MSGAAMNIAARPCYYDPQIVCDDCNGQPATCRRLIAQDQNDDDGEL